MSEKNFLKNHKKKIKNGKFKEISRTKLKKYKIKAKINTKRKVFNNFNLNIKNFDFFNIICGNVFHNFLSVGQRNFDEIDKIMQKYFDNFEYIILSFILNFESGKLTVSESFEFLKKNPILNNIYYFLNLLKTLTWEQFCQFTDKLNLLKKKKTSKINITLITLDTLKKIINLKNLLKSLSEGFINEEHFKIAIKKYKFNKNLSSVLLNQNIINYLDNIKLTNNNLNIEDIFLNNTIGFYDAVIAKYSKYSLYSQSTSKDNLSVLLKKHRWVKLNAAKNTGKLSYVHALALAYIGNPLKLPFAPKPINLRYRAYRIFLYAFKLKPFKLWQLTRKSRNYKYGGLLIDHLSKYELTIQNILLMSNFCLSLPEVKTYLQKGTICVNGKIILSDKYVIRPYDVIHFIANIFREERNRFLLNISSAIYKNIFNKEFSQLFEYNFKVFCFTILPNFFKYRKLSLAPYYTIYNSGRFRIEKI